MKILSYLLLFLTLFNIANGQYSEKQFFVYKGNSYDIFKIRQDSFLADKCSVVETNNLNDEKAFFTSFPDNNFFAIVSSIVDSTCNPLGLFIKNSQIINPTNTNTQGIGTFFSIQPNGIFYISDENDFNVSSTQDFIKINPKCRFAIQTGPLLVNENQINNQFTLGSKNKFMRCGVGIYKKNNEKYIIFIKSNNPVNFYDFADLFFNNLGCSYALSLESGSNCSIHFPSHLKFSDKINPCRYFLIDLH